MLFCATVEETITGASASKMNASNETWQTTNREIFWVWGLFDPEWETVQMHLPLIQLIVSESCLCFISANTRLLLQHTINYSTFSTRMWGGAREKWMTKSAERGWSVAEVICEPFSCRPHKLNVQSCTRLSPSLSCPLILKHSPCAFLSTPPSASLLLHHFRSSAWQPNCVCP